MDKCSKCGSEVWDNRENKRNPKSPDFKCKDKNCGHAEWLKPYKKDKVFEGTKTKEDVPKEVWEAKDLRMVRMNSWAHAVNIVTAHLNSKPEKETVSIEELLKITADTAQRIEQNVYRGKPRPPQDDDSLAQEFFEGEG